MGEAIAILVVIWAWALVLLSLGAFVEWLGGVRGRRKRARRSEGESTGAV